METTSEAITEPQSQEAMQENLRELIAKATALNGIKDYSAAAEVYSEAAELQTMINGEMSPDNADLLYAYGRCLFFVAQKQSTVLGGTATQAQLSREDKKKPSSSKKRKLNGLPKLEETTQESSVGVGNGDVILTSTPADLAPDATVNPDATGTSSDANDKPFFQFNGDENYTDSEGDESEGEGEEEEDDDDFETSFELLDLARILFQRKLDAIQSAVEVPTSDKGKAKAVTADPEGLTLIHELKSRIADIYDLQAEISLEGEKFPAAVADLKSCLELKQELEPAESNLLAECHYKLSLALEAASQEQQRDADGNPVGEITINWDVRNDAVNHLDEAIQCCRLKVEKEKKTMSTLEDNAAQVKSQEQIEDVEDMITSMEERLVELKKPPVSVKAETENDFNKEMMAGVLGQIMGGSGSKEQQKEELAKVIAGANDLSGMIKKKSKKSTSRTATAADETASNASTSSKRKMDSSDMVEDRSGDKRAKMEEAEDSGI